MEQRLIIEVPLSSGRRRLEDFLLDHFPNLSKMYLRDVVKRELCEVNGRNENIGYRVRPNDLVEITLDMTRGTAMRAEEIPLQIVYEDGAMVVVNKPAGMLVHPSHREKSGTVLNALTYHLNRSARALVRPGLVHRLDKLTSGLLIVAKTASSHKILARHFLRKRVDKRYLALVDGLVESEVGEITEPIGRYPELKHWSVKEDGKHSHSRYQVRRRASNRTLLELEPVTGRTNQLRIHCQAIGHPIVGDVSRGGPVFNRLCLHAWRLRLPHPLTNELMSFETDLPEFAR